MKEDAITTFNRRLRILAMFKGSEPPEQERRDLPAFRIALDFPRRRVQELQIQNVRLKGTRPPRTPNTQKRIANGYVYPRGFLGITLGIEPGKNGNFHRLSSPQRFGISRPDPIIESGKVRTISRLSGDHQGAGQTNRGRSGVESGCARISVAKIGRSTD
ncbi:MAG: hypothetical protein RKO24_03050 [Candidatus Competibacter sp.]|nr:hypothetical protein [Candidatus Competibacter sp.]